MCHWLVKERRMIKTHPMWNTFPNIQALLLECLELIIEKTTIDNKEIEETVLEMIRNQGKLLRPAYFLLFSRLGQTTKESHDQIISAAASTEVLHLATLIHDDIIDESTGSEEHTS